MKEEVLTTLKSLSRASTDDYARVIESSVRSLAYVVAAFLFAGELARDAAARLEEWMGKWQGEPFVPPTLEVVGAAPIAVAAPAKPPVKPPTPTPAPVAVVSRGEERSSNNESQSKAVTKSVRRTRHRRVTGFAA